MKNYFTILCFVSVLSCNYQQPAAPVAVAKKDSSFKVSANPLPATTALTILPFDKNNILIKDRVKGKIVDGARFKDAEGESYVLLTEQDNIEKDNTHNKSIYAYCFAKQSDSFLKKWVVQDNITGCDLDATCEFLPGSLSITDVDNNRIAEATFLYRLSCKGDVSPHSKKLIIYQGATKFAIRGSTILQTPAGKEGGFKKIDASFTGAPKALLDYANKQWDKFGFEKY